MTARLAVPDARHLRLARGDVLVRSGAPFAGLYILRSGSCKQVAVSPDGEEHILAFCHPGDVLGLEALAAGTHDATLCAMETITCWHASAAHVERLLREDSAFAATLAHTLSQAFGRAMRRELRLGTMTAAQRVASFLLDLVDRHHALGFARDAVELRMTRAEIGSHLGVSAETVSRTLARFHVQRHIAVTGRSVRLCDRAALLRVLLHRD